MFTPKSKGKPFVEAIKKPSETILFAEGF